MDNARGRTSRTRHSQATALGLGISLLIPSAHATYVDFRDMSFADAKGQASYQFSVSGLEVVLSTNLKDTVLWWDVEDGFGVNSPSSYEADEIEGPEKLFVRFSSPVTLTQFFVSDLYHERGYDEMGFYEIEGQGNGQGFLATRSSTNGERSVDVNQELRLISFSSLGHVEWQHHEFALRGLSFNYLGEQGPSPIPVPAAAWLWVSGLASLVCFRRKSSIVGIRDQADQSADSVGCVTRAEVEKRPCASAPQRTGIARGLRTALLKPRLLTMRASPASPRYQQIPS